MALIHWLGNLIEPSVAAWIIVVGVILLALFCLAKLEWEVIRMHRGDAGSAEKTIALREYQRTNKDAKKAGN